MLLSLEGHVKFGEENVLYYHLYDVHRQLLKLIKRFYPESQLQASNLSRQRVSDVSEQNSSAGFLKLSTPS